MKNIEPMTIAALNAGYRENRWSPRDVVMTAREKAADPAFKSIWIHLLTPKELEPYLQRLEKADPAEKPLYGVPFAIKDNIDLAGIPTTAACPDYAYTPEKSAFVVDLLIEAGALPLGKTNLDQFATGLVGVRSPYGTPPNPFGADLIPGGSSSGSASALAHGLVAFALGTDTAGSGRVPAAFNNLVGWKPTKGRLSTSGVVPACRSLDCVSVFAANADDLERILPVVSKEDPADAFSRCVPRCVPDGNLTGSFGVPEDKWLKFFGNDEYRRLYYEAVENMEALGYRKTIIDAEPFIRTAELLYGGPWVTERWSALKDFFRKENRDIWPETEKIISGGETFSATELFEALYKLQDYKKKSDATWKKVDFLMIPTAGTIYTKDEIAADPIGANSNLGYYTNFMNLLDLSAVAAPAGFTKEHLPFGVTLCSPAFQDRFLLSLVRKWESVTVEGTIDLAVCGAHLSGLPLNYQLRERQAPLIRTAKTAPEYSFYRLDTEPPKPGLVRQKQGGGAVDVEIYRMPLKHLGSFLKMIPSPLGLGKLKLEDGSFVTGFVMESFAVDPKDDVTELGNWRKVISS